MNNPLTEGQTNLVKMAIGVAVTFGLIYVTFLVAGKGWTAGEKAA